MIILWGAPKISDLEGRSTSSSEDVEQDWIEMRPAFAVIERAEWREFGVRIKHASRYDRA